MPPPNCLHPKNCMDSYLHGCWYACDDINLSLKEAKAVQRQIDFDTAADQAFRFIIPSLIVITGILMFILFVGALAGFPNLY